MAMTSTLPIIGTDAAAANPNVTGFEVSVRYVRLGNVGTLLGTEPHRDRVVA